jgi:hypothetical protein
MKSPLDGQQAKVQATTVIMEIQHFLEGEACSAIWACGINKTTEKRVDASSTLHRTR